MNKLICHKKIMNKIKESNTKKKRKKINMKKK